MAITIQDILNIDTVELRKLSAQQLERMVKRGKQYANQRLFKLEKAKLDITSPAYRKYVKELNNNRFTLTVGNKLRQISDLRKLQHFLSSETSTVKGARKFEKRQSKLLSHVPREEWGNFWDRFNELIQSNKVRYRQLDSGQVVKALQNVYDASKTVKELITEMEVTFNELYDSVNEQFKSYAIDPTKYR